jgi:hypothetical protein
MKYLWPCLLILLAGCSSTKEESAEEKYYSEDTNRAFLEIERGGTYSKKRERSAPPPQLSYKPVKKAPPKKVTPPVERMTETKNEVRESAPQEEAGENEIQIDRLMGTNQERLVEINQNLAFYCMKHRKSRAFGGDEKKCLSYVNKTLTNCQKTHKKADSKLLVCLNKTLKKKP